ncbi:MAG: fatty acid desaturase [Bacteroidia bacterium]
MYAQISQGSIQYRKKVKELAKRKVSDFPLWRNLFIALTFFIGTPVLLFSTPALWSWWGILILAPILAVGFTMIGTTQHTAAHGAFSKDKKVSKFVSRAMFLLGIWLPNWVLEHNHYHHLHTNSYGMDRDLDSAEKVKMVFSPKSKIKPTHKQARWLFVMSLYALTFISWIPMADFTRLKRYHGLGRFPNKSWTRTVSEMAIFKACYFFVIMGIPLILGTPWYIVIPFWIVGWAMAGMLMMPIFQIAHINMFTQHYDDDHSPKDEGYDFYEHTLNTTIDFYWETPIFDKIMTNVIGWLNYQTPHHHFRGIHPRYYAEVSKLIETEKWPDGVKYYRVPIVKAIKSHFEYLGNLTREEFRAMRSELHDM